eukprot:s304_g12.t1
MRGTLFVRRAPLALGARLSGPQRRSLTDSMRCAIVFGGQRLEIALELLLPGDDLGDKAYVLLHKVVPGVDVGNLVCATGAARAWRALGWSPLSALRGGRRGGRLPQIRRSTQLGPLRTALHKSDGAIEVFGRCCNTRPLPHGMTFTQLSAGRRHTVFLRTDGIAVVSGLNSHGHGDIPPLPDGTAYSQVPAGEDTTACLRSDGAAAAYGRNCSGQCDIPTLPPGTSYVADVPTCSNWIALISMTPWC